MDNRCRLDNLPPAQAELEEIARVHMALSGPQSAQNITDRIYDAMDQLTRFPLSGPPVRDDESSAAGYRYILAGKYLVFYRLLGDTMVIYHIAMARQIIPSYLKPHSFPDMSGPGFWAAHINVYTGWLVLPR